MKAFVFNVIVLSLPVIALGSESFSDLGGAGVKETSRGWGEPVRGGTLDIESFARNAEEKAPAATGGEEGKVTEKENKDPKLSSEAAAKPVNRQPSVKKQPLSPPSHSLKSMEIPPAVKEILTKIQQKVGAKAGKAYVDQVHTLFRSVNNGDLPSSKQQVANAFQELRTHSQALIKGKTLQVDEHRQILTALHTLYQGTSLYPDVMRSQQHIAHLSEYKVV